MYARKTKTKRITLNLPADLLAEARRVTGKNITDTIVTGLERIKRGSAYEKALKLRSKLDLNVDLEVSRERRR
jgi:hypothetical protein